MPCPSCGALLDASRSPSRCSCGWSQESARGRALKLLAAGACGDLLGTTLLVWSVLQDRALLPAAVALLAAGGALLVLGLVGWGQASKPASPAAERQSH